MDEQTAPSTRLPAIDELRGLVMIFMALDHVRDFEHADASLFSPTDLTKTSAILFFTRWVTHFCMPVFMFLAGVGAFFYGQHRQSVGELSQFLWKRGVWFILLEFSVMQFAYNFNFSLNNILMLLILWIFGICFVAMTALIRLPIRWLAILSISVILLHNCLDYIRFPSMGFGSNALAFLHSPNFFKLAGFRILTAYPPIPWIAVMGAGYCFGQLLLLEPLLRQRIIGRLGFGVTAAFLVVRAINVYGDPAPWSYQKSAAITFLSFLNTTKYPPSFEFLLMTLGPAFLLLALFERCNWKRGNPLLIFGRVPLFYFILHFYAIHALLEILACFRYGTRSFQFIFNPVPAMGGPREMFPSNFGYPLWAAYLCWILLLVGLYPCCRWFARIKATRRDWWLSYL